MTHKNLNETVVITAAEMTELHDAQLNAIEGGLCDSFGGPHPIVPPVNFFTPVPIPLPR
jgi:hypothetical protein